jgi:hypothetical protein
VTTACGRSLGELCAIGLLATAALLSYPGTVTAGCGDYVTVLKPDGSVAEHPHHDPTTPGAPRGPCRGANCSAPDAPPVAPPAPRAGHTGGADEWATDLSEPPDSDPSFTSRAPSHSSGRPVRRTAETFHPPRPI